MDPLPFEVLIESFVEDNTRDGPNSQALIDRYTATFPTRPLAQCLRVENLLISPKVNLLGILFLSLLP